MVKTYKQKYVELKVIHGMLETENKTLKNRVEGLTNDKENIVRDNGWDKERLKEQNEKISGLEAMIQPYKELVEILKLMLQKKE